MMFPFCKKYVMTVRKQGQLAKQRYWITIEEEIILGYNRYKSIGHCITIRRFAFLFSQKAGKPDMVHRRDKTWMTPHVSFVSIDSPFYTHFQIAFPSLSPFQKHVFTVCSSGEGHVTSCFVIVQLKNSCTLCTPILSSPLQGRGHDLSDVAPLPLPKPEAVHLFQDTGLPKKSMGGRHVLWRYCANGKSPSLPLSSSPSVYPSFFVCDATLRL